MKKVRVIKAIFMFFALFACSKKVNPIFSEMPLSPGFVFMSDTLNNDVILRKNRCILRIDKKEQIVNGRRYYGVSMCSADNRNTNALVRRTDSKVYIYQQAGEKYGFGEQLLFDFDREVGDCWSVNTLDKMQICIAKRYSYSNGDTIVVHAIKHINNVTDYPLILEYHVGSRIGIIKLKFSDGDYLIEEKR